MTRPTTRTRAALALAAAATTAAGLATSIAPSAADAAGTSPAPTAITSSTLPSSSFVWTTTSPRGVVRSGALDASTGLIAIAPPGMVPGTLGGVTVEAGSRADRSGWRITLRPADGQRLTTGHHESDHRVSDDRPRVGVEADIAHVGLPEQSARGEVVLRHLRTDPSGRVTAIDAEVHLRYDTGTRLHLRIRENAPVGKYLSLSSQSPVTVAGQATAFTAVQRPGQRYRVAFRAGEKVIGAALPDSDGVARFMTNALPAGVHRITAQRLDLRTNAPVGAPVAIRQLVRHGDTSVTTTSTAGDWVGRGAIGGWTARDRGVVRVSSSGRERVTVVSGGSTSPLRTTFGRAGGGVLKARTYGTMPYGLPVSMTSGSGRCAQQGPSRINSVAWNRDGSLRWLSADVSTRCSGVDHAMTHVRFGVPKGWSSTHLETDRVSRGSVRLTASVATTTGPARGTVTFSNGTTVLGHARLSAWGRANIVVPASASATVMRAQYDGQPATPTSPRVLGSTDLTTTTIG